MSDNMSTTEINGGTLIIMILLAEKPNGFYSTRSLDTRDGAASVDDNWSTRRPLGSLLSN
jgi:hypothetical protein